MRTPARQVTLESRAMAVTSWLSFPSLLRTLVSSVRLTLRLVRDPAVPRLAKVLPLAAVFYLLSPIDGVPDLIPVLGQLDDLGVLMLALESFLRLCPEDVVAFHRSAMAAGRPYGPVPPSAQVFDAEFRRDDGQ